MSELPPTPRGLFTGSLGNRYVMDYLRVMSGLGYHLLARRQIDAFIKSQMTLSEANELLEMMTRLAQKSARTELAGVPTPPRPTRQALMTSEISRRANVMKGKPKFLLIKGDKE